MYRIAKASEYLVITGKGIGDIKIAKKSWVFPWQLCTILDLSPMIYKFNVQGMSAEELPFVLPVVFTIGPKADELECLLKYGRLLSAHDQHSNHVNDLVQGVIEREKHVNDLVQGVIEREIRVLAASMTMEQIFKGTEEFKKQVFDHVQLELNQFGLLIYYAYVKQVVDVPGHEYFSYLEQKIQMEAEARMKGEIGSKTREGETLRNAAKIDAETKVIATRRTREGQKEGIKVKAEVKIFENEREAEVAEAELQKEVNALTRTEKLFLTKADIDYETKVQKANGLFYQKQKEAEAFLFETEKKAEAQKTMAAAALFVKMKEADGELYSKLKEAEGIVALGQAQGTYLRTLLDSLNGNYIALREYLIINGGLIQDMARLQP